MSKTYTPEEEKALFRRLIDQLRIDRILTNIDIVERLESNKITQTQVLSAPTVIREWEELDDTITKGTVTRYNGLVYQFIADEPYSKTTQPNWTPEGYVSGWKMFRSTDPNYALPYKFRSAIDVFMTGEYMIWTDGNVYKSKVDNNSWTPDTAADKWQLYNASGNVDEPDPDEPTDPTDPYADVEDYVVGKWYQQGDMVRYNGKIYKSIFAGDNVWTPDGYPQGWELVGTIQGTIAHAVTAEAALPYERSVYMQGEYITENGKVYKCLEDDTIHPPTIAAVAHKWELIE